jgi:predicted nuclease with RNAse H fold
MTGTANIFRPCDRELLHRGIKFFPITLGPMRMLTERGIRLRRRLERAGIPALEMYPGGAQDVWGIRRKQYGLGRLRSGLRNLGITGLTPDMTHDELDAVTGAYVGVLYLRGRAELIGDERTGGILLPYPRKGTR